MHSERMQWSWRVVRAVVLAATVAAPVSAQDTTPDLKRMTIEDLLDVEVTTVSRHPEPVTSVPAAVFVITPDDIRRSGAACARVSPTTASGSPTSPPTISP